MFLSLTVSLPVARAYTIAQKRRKRADYAEHGAFLPSTVPPQPTNSHSRADDNGHLVPTYSISDVFRSGDPELLNSQLSPHEVSYTAHARRTQLSTRNTIMSDHENLRADQTTTPQSVQTRNHAADELGHLNFSTLQANAIEDSLIPDINGISPHFFPPMPRAAFQPHRPFQITNE